MANTTGYSTNLGLSLTPEYDSSKFPEAWQDSVRVRNSIRVLQAALDAYTGNTPAISANYSAISPQSSLQIQNLCKIYLPCSDVLIPGCPVNIYDSGAGAAKARLASSAAAATLTRGIYVDAANSVIGNTVPILLFGADFFISGLTVGALYYTQDAPGTLGVTPGTVPQVVGVALSTNLLWLNPSLV